MTTTDATFRSPLFALALALSAIAFSVGCGPEGEEEEEPLGAQSGAPLPSSGTISTTNTDSWSLLMGYQNLADKETDEAKAISESQNTLTLASKSTCTTRCLSTTR